LPEKLTKNTHNQPESMTKHEYFYEDLKDGANNCIVTSLVQVSELTGTNIRTLYRIFNGNNVYCDVTGKYRVIRATRIPDKRKNNGKGW
jgi:hypothetical protein